MGALPPLRALDAAPMEASASVMSDAAKASADSAAPTPYRAFAAGDGGTVLKYTELGTSEQSQAVWLVPQDSNGDPLPLPTGMSFDLTSIQYPSDQPYDGCIPGTGLYTHGGQTYPYFEITIYVGLHGTTPPAQWFTSFCGGNEVGNEGGETSPTSPSDLNFAFSGTLTANAGYTIAFGQGHNGEGNNWWIGGPGFSIVAPMSEDNPSIATPDSAWLFTADGGAADNVPYASGNYVFIMTPN